MPHKLIRVLIAEDDFLVSEMIQGLLESIGYTVVGKAASGQQAIELAAELKPDVILMDINLQGLDGLQAAQSIHDSQPTPVVVLTAYETPDLLAQASAAGVGAYLVKPPNPQEMERAIVIAMARFRDLMELRQLNAELETFAQTVAHDLKNPLTRIIGFAQTLAEEYTVLPHQTVKDFLDEIAQTGFKINNIIEELLLLASVRRQEIEAKPLPMCSIVAEAQRRLSALIAKHDAHITLPGNWPIAVGHGPWVEEVWVNYLSNAIKYGGRPPRLELGATLQADGMVRFWVRDNGAGISLEDQARLFTPFTRLEQARATGHGLGLSIARRIVEKLGGQVGLESKPGQGSLFSFTLPGMSLG